MHKHIRSRQSLPAMPTATDIKNQAANDPTQLGTFISVTDLRTKYGGDECRGIGLGIEWTLIKDDVVPLLKFIVMTREDACPCLPVRVYCTTDMKARFIVNNQPKNGIFPAWCTFTLGAKSKGKQMYKCVYIRMTEKDKKAWGSIIKKMEFPALKYGSEAIRVCVISMSL